MLSAQDLATLVAQVHHDVQPDIGQGRVGDSLWQRVGREPSGSPFNSIVQLEREQGIPRNPLINAGALVVTDAILAGRRPAPAIAVWSPGLNASGNSLVGALALESLSRHTGWSVF